MRCPICGAKLKEQKCVYCKITNKQVIFASNKEAKKVRLKKVKQQDVYNSDVLPKDVSKVKLWFFLVIGGWFGADSFLTGKYNKGLFSLFSYVALFLSAFFVTLSGRLGWGNNAEYTFRTLMSFLSIFGVITFMFWFVGVIQLLTKKYKFPVVLPSEKDAEILYQQDLELQQKKQLEKEEKKENKNG